MAPFREKWISHLENIWTDWDDGRGSWLWADTHLSLNPSRFSHPQLLRGWTHVAGLTCSHYFYCQPIRRGRWDKAPPPRSYTKLLRSIASSRCFLYARILYSVSWSLEIGRAHAHQGWRTLPVLLSLMTLTDTAGWRMLMLQMTQRYKSNRSRHIITDFK